MSQTIDITANAGLPPAGERSAGGKEPVFPAPPNPLRPYSRLEPFAGRLQPPAAYRLPADTVTHVEMRAADVSIHPHLPPVPVWGYALDGEVSVPGPLLEARAGRVSLIRFDNRLPGRPELPFLTNLAPDPADGEPDPQNQLGPAGEAAEDLTGAPLGWTSVHLHGGHSRADADGWPDNMAPATSSGIRRRPGSGCRPARATAR